MEFGKGRDNLKSDEVLLKGGKKGVAGAVAEIMDVRAWIMAKSPLN